MSSLLGIRLGPRLVRQLITNQASYRPATVIPFRKLSIRSWFKKDVTTVDAKPEAVKTEYEIEVEKFTKKDGYHKYYGYSWDDPGLDEIFFKVFAIGFFTVALGFIPVIFFYGPDFNAQMIPWRKREAIMQIERRMAEGKMVIDPDYAPADLIEKMVPPPGDWEEQWLKKQPTTMNLNQPQPYAQVIY